MARLEKIGKDRGWRVSWVEHHFEERSSRSKIIHDEVKARRFLALVEAAGEKYPNFTALHAEKLESLAHEISPQFVYMLYRVIHEPGMRATERIKHLKFFLKDF